MNKHELAELAAEYRRRSLDRKTAAAMQPGRHCWS
jgi:hypothetical protein